MLKILRLSRLLRGCRGINQSLSFVRNQSTDKPKYSEQFNSDNVNSEVPKVTIASSKYKIFKDEDSEMILDIYEEGNKYAELLEEDEDHDAYEGLNLNRGFTGVYDIEDLVEVLKRENGIDIFVAAVNKDIDYVDYICVVSGKSMRHMQAIAQFVRRVYKMKRHQGDIVPRLEGKDSSDWMAIDLGNIALHIFSKESRKLYDLESLWALGPQYDSEYNKQDPVAEMLEKYSEYLKDLKPAK